MDRAAAPDPGGQNDEAAGNAVSRCALLVGAAAAAVGVRSAAGQTPPTPLQLDDASQLNRIPIARHWQPTQVTGDAWLDALRAELKAAAAEGRPVSVGAARHSMGGQALPPAGVAMTFDIRASGTAPPGGASAWIEPNRDSRT